MRVVPRAGTRLGRLSGDRRGDQPEPPAGDLGDAPVQGPLVMTWRPAAAASPGVVRAKPGQQPVGAAHSAAGRPSDVGQLRAGYADDRRQCSSPMTGSSRAGE
jgi:hypothetical protein